MSSQAQKVALPAYMPKRLEAFRIGAGAKQSYMVRDKLQGKTYDFEPWQFFVLEVLPGCEDFPKLASVFEDRFGYPLTREQLDLLLASVADSSLFEDAADHPLLAPFRHKCYTTDDGQAKVKSFRSQLPEAPASPSASNTSGESTEEDLPAGVQDAVGLDARAVRKMWVLFDPRPFLKRTVSVVVQLKYMIYPLPLIATAALFIAIQHGHLIAQDTSRLLGATSVFGHAVFSMFSVNLLITLTTAYVAHHYRGTVSAIGVALFFGFLPRFVTRVSHVHQLSRRERMWLHGAPLLMRLTLFSLGILLWYNTRDTNGVLPEVGLALGVICAMGLLISANPLVKGSGYHLLAAFLNEPHLRGKSYKALLNKLRGTVYKEADEPLLAAYALASFAFMFVMVIVVVLIFGLWLRSLQLGGTAVIIAGLLGIFLFRRTLKRLKKIEAAYERSVQFDRWRKRTLPADLVKGVEEPEKAGGGNVYAKRALMLAALVVLFLPYRYEAGGQFVVYPSQRQVITTDVPGVIEEVYFDGGEDVRKGTVVARLSFNDYQSQFDVFTAKMQEQQSVINELKSRPKPEEVRVAQSALDVARTREEYSKDRVDRIEKLYKDGAVSLEELASTRREYQVDVNQVSEKQAALDLVKVGATRDEIAAATAKWQSLKEERDAFKDKIARSVLTMPFDGKLLTLHLKQKTKSYLEKGAPFAVVENSGQVTVEIEVPESEIGYAAETAKVRAKPTSYYDQTFPGTVTTIDNNVTAKSFGNVVKVVALVDNKEGKLKTGMTGYAKIEGPSLPVWKAFSLAVIRFVNVQVWSWIP